MIKSGSFPALKGESKIVTQADMWSKLARNAKPKVSVSVDGSGEGPRAPYDKGIAPTVPGAPTSAASAVQSAGVASNEPITGAAIDWLPPEKYGPGAWGLTSVCGRFWLHAVRTQTELKITAWRRGTGLLGLNEKLGEAGTAEEAKRMCEGGQAQERSHEYRLRQRHHGIRSRRGH